MAWPHAAGVIAMAVLCGSAAARSFQAEGADTGAGLGARWVAQGGTGVATADDLYALYTNPAGLASLGGLQLGVSRQLDARLHPFNFVGAGWQLPLPAASGWRVGVAAAFYPRIHARATGAYGDADFESLFLRYLLPGINGNFDGSIDSKTKSWRVGLGVAPAAADAAWSAGLYLERVDCRSTFCGIHAESNGFTTQSAGATAVAAGLGLRWRPAPGWTLGAAVSDLRTRLTVKTVTTDDAGTRENEFSADFPRKIALALAWQGEAWRLAGDLEKTKGRYGRSEIDLQVLRLGAERFAGPWAWRAGAVVPLRIFSSGTGRLHAPFPLAPTLGLGWRSGPWQLDLALYAHAVMSMHKDRASPAADASVMLQF